MSIEGPKDIDALRQIGAIVALVRDTMGAAVEKGISTADLDAIGKDILRKTGARSAPQLAYNFPGATCISVNDAIAHGIPSASRILQEGDLVNIDVSAELDGYWADTGASFAVGKVSLRADALLVATRLALEEAMSITRTGTPIRNIGKMVQQRAKKHGFQVIRNLCGHGVGRYIHEDPSISNVFDARDRDVLTEGLVMTIEPFLTFNATLAIEDEDGWTMRTPNGSIGAQFEHTMIVTADGPIVLT